jgi:hypothetical protein
VPCCLVPPCRITGTGMTLPQLGRAVPLGMAALVPGVEEEGKWSYLAARRRRRKRGEFEVDGPAGRHGTDAEGVGRRRIIEGEGWPSARHRGEGVDWPTSAALRRSGRPPARRRGPGSGEASRRREPPACQSAATGVGTWGAQGTATAGWGLGDGLGRGIYTRVVYGLLADQDLTGCHRASPLIVSCPCRHYGPN